jgi:hypothetical protein
MADRRRALFGGQVNVWVTGFFAAGSRFLPCLCLALLPMLRAQQIIPPEHAGGIVHLFPSDLAILESDDARKDLPCTVIGPKPVLGFDLRFHIGYQATLPLAELAGNGGQLTVLFRIYPESQKREAAYFVQHFRVPPIQDDAKGDVSLEGGIDAGVGSYHIDWLMRDRTERVCSSSWDTVAKLGDKEQMPLFLAPDQITESLPEPFVNDPPGRLPPTAGPLHLKLLVNFAPQNANAAALQDSDTGALVSLLKEIERDPRVGRLSLVAFDLPQTRVIYRQPAAQRIDFPALGAALRNVKLGTVDLHQLSEKHSETDFLDDLIEHELSGPSQPDAIVFAGPKAMLDADVPQEDLRRIGTVECPVFYMNYNLFPQAVPWKDSISHAIRVFKGTEYTISCPRDLWSATTEMLNRVMRFKRERAAAGRSPSAGGGTAPASTLGDDLLPASQKR